jgi:hypothetical protein
VNVERIEEEEKKKSEFESENGSGRSSSKPLVALTTMFCSVPYCLTSSDMLDRREGLGRIYLDV